MDLAKEVPVEIQIRNSSSDPIYLQIKNQLKAAIISGELPEAAQLPSIRHLAKELRVSVITTKRAYDELELEGFLDSVPGKGSFVTARNSEIVREEYLRKLEAALAEAAKFARLSGVTPEELTTMLHLATQEDDDE